MADREAFLGFLRRTFTEEEIDRLTTTEKADLSLRYEQSLRAGNNCVVFIMWLLSGDFISSSV